jgi:hypothetical protein
MLPQDEGFPVFQMTIDMTLAGDGAEVARPGRVGLRQKPQPTDKGQQLLPA